VIGCVKGGREKKKKVAAHRQSRRKQMLGNGTTALHLRIPPHGKIWICTRCFHARSRYYAEQQTEQKTNSPSPDPSTPENLSPMELFRRRFSQQQTSNETTNTHLSPSEILGTNWMKVPIPEKKKISKVFDRKLFSFESLAQELRGSAKTQQYLANDERASNMNVPEKDKLVSKEMAEESELQRLIEMDEGLDDSEGDLFGGECMHDYQGVLPLEGSKYVQQKFPIKRGALVEIRLYTASFI